MTLRPIIVGSVNPSKMKGVCVAFADYPSFPFRRDDDDFMLDEEKVAGIPAPSGVNEQPIGIEEILTGAENRARHVLRLHPDAVAVGIESGVYDVRPGLIYDVCACFLLTTDSGPWKTVSSAFGLSSAWAIPRDVAAILREGKGLVTMDDAFLSTGRSHAPRLGYSDGAIGLLTGGILTRAMYTAQAVTAALVGWSPA